jgi:hypothetical protein
LHQEFRILKQKIGAQLIGTKLDPYERIHQFTLQSIVSMNTGIKYKVQFGVEHG